LRQRHSAEARNRPVTCYPLREISSRSSQHRQTQKHCAVADPFPQKGIASLVLFHPKRGFRRPSYSG
jgi:hypothetical protein